MRAAIAFAALLGFCGVALAAGPAKVEGRATTVTCPAGKLTIDGEPPSGNWTCDDDGSIHFSPAPQYTPPLTIRPMDWSGPICCASSFPNPASLDYLVGGQQ